VLVFRELKKAEFAAVFVGIPALLTVVAAMAVSPNILVVLGPTASGKSDLAMRLAQAVGAEILSVDSMQVYRGMDIGTAKPSAAERTAVKHHGIDLIEPSETFTVARFVEYADAVIREAAARYTPLIATGGTPLYYKALFEGLFEGPGADAAIRDHLRAHSNEELHQRLAQVDPPTAARVHVQDTKRLIRALEVFELTGKPISSFQTEWSAAAEPRHAALWIGLLWDKDMLNRRINARVKAMLDAGWLDETRTLLARHPGSLSPTAAEATGYHELAEQLKGNISLDEAIEQIKIATRQLARRQMKWFRRFRGVHWLPGDTAPEDLTRRVMELWEPDA
jgi:tRNA dimethylallyltransferase